MKLDPQYIASLSLPQFNTGTLGAHPRMHLEDWAAPHTLDNTRHPPAHVLPGCRPLHPSGNTTSPYTHNGHLLSTLRPVPR